MDRERYTHDNSFMTLDPTAKLLIDAATECVCTPDVHNAVAEAQHCATRRLVRVLAAIALEIAALRRQIQQPYPNEPFPQAAGRPTRKGARNPLAD
jgi:hypothetical protein